jgi:hypothetical protein
MAFGLAHQSLNRGLETLFKDRPAFVRRGLELDLLEDFETFVDQGAECLRAPNVYSDRRPFSHSMV